MFQLILIVIHEALTLLFLPVSCHYTRPRSARTHLAALAGAKNVALDADLPCVFLGGGRVVQVQNCCCGENTCYKRTWRENISYRHCLVKQHSLQASFWTLVTNVLWKRNTGYKRTWVLERCLQASFPAKNMVTVVFFLKKIDMGWRRKFEFRHKLKNLLIWELEGQDITRLCHLSSVILCPVLLVLSCHEEEIHHVAPRVAPHHPTISQPFAVENENYLPSKMHNCVQ